MRKYYIRAYAIVNNQTYYSDQYSFTTRTLIGTKWKIKLINPDKINLNWVSNNLTFLEDRKIAFNQQMANPERILYNYWDYDNSLFWIFQEWMNQPIKNPVKIDYYRFTGLIVNDSTMAGEFWINSTQNKGNWLADLIK